MQIKFGNAQIKIEDISSDSLVKQFVRQENQKKHFVWAYFQLTTGDEVSQFGEHRNKQFIPVAKHVASIKWTKIDLNYDGKKDLIISGVTKKPEGKTFEDAYRLLIFLSNDTSYQQIDLVPNYLEQFPVYFNIIYVDAKPCLEFTRLDVSDELYETLKIVKDTIIYKFGDFIDYNSIPSNLKLDTLIYYTESNWVAYQPDYFIINEKGKISYRKGAFPIKNSIEINSSISKEKLIDIIKLINYVNPVYLKENYSKPASDLGNTHLILKYKNGTIKHINDYGHYGTYGLKAIYSQIQKIINNLLLNKK